VADLASQICIVSLLRRADAGYAFLAEEDDAVLTNQPALVEEIHKIVLAEIPDLSSEELTAALTETSGVADPTSEAFFTLDPIDGTKGFLRGDQYALALAYLEEGRPIMGVLGCPNLEAPDGSAQGILYRAVEGEGAAWAPLDDLSTWHSLPAKSSITFADARFCESVESGHAAHDLHAAIADRLGIQAEPFRIDSQCKYAAVADGRASIYLRLSSKKGYTEKIWDHAAGVLVVEEAGGTVSDASGKPLEFTHGPGLEANSGIVATRGVDHAAVIQALGSS
jgi:3'(2'), 5'-bisphosphate nucleotidase